jgi:predicted transcriptional regulator
MSEAITWIEDGNDFKGVEAFLSEYQATPDDLGDLGTFTEEDAAEALAVSWSEQRREIAKLKQSRQFGAVSKDRRSFRVEIEELKKKTR